MESSLFSAIFPRPGGKKVVVMDFFYAIILQDMKAVFHLFIKDTFYG